MLTYYYIFTEGPSKLDTADVQTQKLDAGLEVYCLSIVHHEHDSLNLFSVSFNTLTNRSEVSSIEYKHFMTR